MKVLLEEIKYYDINSLKKYIKTTIAPLLELSDIVRKYFMEVDENIAKYAEEIYSMVKKVIELAEEDLGLKLEPRSLTEPKDIYEVIEYGRRFLEKAFNFTTVCNPFTFFIWSIRKITRAYLEAHYPKLFEENKFKEISSILGLEEYWKPPEIKPRKIMEDYTLYAYLDFETEEENPKDTIGGLISKINEKVLFKLSIADIKAYGVLYEKPGLYDKYRNIVNKLLEKLNWKQDSKIAGILYSEGAYFRIDGLIVDLTYKTPMWHRDIHGRVYKGYELKQGPRIPLFNFLDEIMPLQMLGVVEIRIDKSKKGGSIKVRI